MFERVYSINDLLEFSLTLRSFASSKAVYFPDNGRKPIHDPSRTIVYTILQIIYKQAKKRATIFRNCREASTG
jgi:hypothetical protein